MQITYKKLVHLTLFLILLQDTLMYLGNTGFSESYFGVLAITAKYTALIILVRISYMSDWGKDYPTMITVIFKGLLVWHLYTIVHGALVVKDYWDWKFLFYSSALFLLIPLSLFIGKNLAYAKSVMRITIKYVLRYGFIIIPLALVTNIEMYSRLMVPISIIILFIPYLKFRHVVLVLIVAATSILIYVGFRANVLKISASVAILGTYYFRSYIPLISLKIAHAVLFLVPLVFLGLGLSGTYNIFVATAESDGFGLASGNDSGENLAADTRTFLYVEVLNSLQKSGRLIIGEGGSGKYETEYFDYLGDNRGRYSSEVGFLNTLLYSGIIGVVFYFLFLVTASYYALYKSNNWLCKMLGLMIAFRWLLYFLEEFTNFDINYYFLWVTMGMACSHTFRKLDDQQMKKYFGF